jgi:hypothetical protein
MELERLVQAQGALANKNGKKLEDAIEGLALQMGCVVIDYRDWINNHILFARQDHSEVLVRNFPYKTIYGNDGRMEFYLSSERLQFKGRIECRYQTVSGSVDEKFPYLYMNCISEDHPLDTIVIAEGKGAKKGAVQWFKQQAAQAPKDRSILILTLEEFVKWFA